MHFGFSFMGALRVIRGSCFPAPRTNNALEHRFGTACAQERRASR